MICISLSEKILSLVLNDGGHLTHGHQMSFSGQDYNIVHYSVDTKTGLIDFNSGEFAREKSINLL